MALSNWLRLSILLPFLFASATRAVESEYVYSPGLTIEAGADC